MPAEGGGISGELNGVYAVVREARGEVGRPNPRHLGERVVCEADEGTEVAAGAEEGDEVLANLLLVVGAAQREQARTEQMPEPTG